MIELSNTDRVKSSPAIRPLAAGEHSVAGPVAAIVCLLSLLLPAVSSAVDPFYERLKEDGIQAYTRGDYESAAVDLRFACFGMLDEPRVLAQCLVFLALSQAEVGDTEALNHTFDRISEVEKGFEALSQLDLSTELRRSLEEHLKRSIPYDRLRRLPAFHDVARQQLEEQIRVMPSEQRRVELMLRMESEPEYSTWQVLLAELDFEDGDYPTALATTEAVLLREPGRQVALCLRGKLGARAGMCDQALVDLDQCSESESQSELDLARLRCQISLGDWDAAELLLSALSNSEIRAPTLRQLAREIKRGRKADVEAAAEVEAGDVATLDAAAEVLVKLSVNEAEALASDTQPPSSVEVEDSAATSSEAAVPESETVDPIETEIERITNLLQVGSRKDLESILTEAHRFADENPGRTEVQLLAAEIAYRLSRWAAAITYFDRAGVFETGRPEHQFYLAVSLYESGDHVTAQEMLRRCLPQLEQTDFVQAYSQRIKSGGN